MIDFLILTARAAFLVAAIYVLIMFIQTQYELATNKNTTHSPARVLFLGMCTAIATVLSALERLLS